jgi:coproporphyrinogen III oxidase
MRSDMDSLFERAAEFFQTLQSEICDGLAAADGKADFNRDKWERPGGGGGLTRVLTDGAVFEKAGVNWSGVEGELPEQFASQIPGEGRSFRATGVSLVLHPASPMLPTTHANFRFLEKGDKRWFGGGADLTPYYFHREDAVHFHESLRKPCDAHPGIGDYKRFKEWCDDYFFIPHRGESRGVGGIFFDYLEQDDMDAVLSFVKDAGRSFLPAYLPIVERRRDEPYGEAERRWQLQRRGRYVEFNLVYDRGTVFGLKTKGRIESILMSLPSLVRWDYGAVPEPGTREAELLAHLKPIDWLGLGSAASAAPTR